MTMSERLTASSALACGAAATTWPCEASSLALRSRTLSLSAVGASDRPWAGARVLRSAKQSRSRMRSAYTMLARSGTASAMDSENPSAISSVHGCHIGRAAFPWHGPMKVRVSRIKCKGYELCTAEAPEVFDIDDSRTALILDGTPNTCPPNWPARSRRRSSPAPNTRSWWIKSKPTDG